MDWNTVKFGFRCRACGHLHLAAHAGEQAIPHACSVCGKGIHFAANVDEAKKVHPELAELSEADLMSRHFKVGPFAKFAIHSNWEVLADCTPERLAEIGLTPDRVEKHTPLPKPGPQRAPAIVNADAHDGVKLQEKVL